MLGSGAPHQTPLTGLRPHMPPAHGYNHCLRQHIRVGCGISGHAAGDIRGLLQQKFMSSIIFATSPFAKSWIRACIVQGTNLHRPQSLADRHRQSREWTPTIHEQLKHDFHRFIYSTTSHVRVPTARHDSKPSSFRDISKQLSQNV